MWGYYDSYLTAFRDVLGLKLPIHEKFSAWEECAIEGGFRYMHEDFCMVSDFPEILLKDEQNRPHCSTGPSHRWRDGFEIYHLHGIRFKKEEWDKWRYSDAQTILKIENTDKRAVLIAEVGAEKILADCQSEIIGTDEFGEVLELKGMKDGNGSPYRFLKAMDPAHQQFVYLRIPPTIDKPRDAEAWTYGVDAYNPIVRV